MEQGKLDFTDPVGFLKIWQKSVKIEKIRSKRTGDDGGTVKIGNTEMRPISSINHPVFPKTDVMSSARFLSEPTDFC
jgi:hypothetical protein